MGIHLLYCAHGNEHIETHHAVCDTFVAIVWDVGFHMEQKQLYALPSNSSTLAINKSTLCSLKMTFAP
jgi:hypothetical protein